METQTIEYKRTWRDDFLKEICGFADAQGGTLYIGIADWTIFYNKTNQNTVEGAREKSREKSSQKSSQKILDLIAADTRISTQEMADCIGISRRAIAKTIAKLQAEGILRRVGPDKGGHWEIVE